MRGIVLGTGVTGPDGGTLMPVGHMIGTGITAMPSIIITTIALSVPDVFTEPVTKNCEQA